MNSKTTFNIAVLPGDGIGPEVISACIEVLKKLEQRVGGYELGYTMLDAGADYYLKSGKSITEQTLNRAADADAMLLGAMGLPSVRYDNGTEISPQLDIRESFELYAGVRPIRTMPGLPVPLSDPRAQNLDVVLVRESTEGLFSARGNTRMDGDEGAYDTMKITRSASERVVDFALKLADRRHKERQKEHGDTASTKLTCVDKANVLGAFAFFRKIFDERVSAYSDLATDYCYVDACGLTLVKQPWIFDVLVTENMFGDILSDVGAALMGGMGMAASADIGDERALFQPAHGSAPDIIGQGKANPTATFLSAAMMLDWLGQKYENQACIEASHELDLAVRRAFAPGNLIPFELGGQSGTDDLTKAVIRQLDV